MNIVTGILGIAFAALHGGPSLAGLRQPVAARGSHDAAAVPIWARLLWLLLALAVLVGAITYMISPSLPVVATIFAGAIGIWLLAVANGFWIHGRPNLRHHLVRAVLIVILLVLTVVGM